MVIEKIEAKAIHAYTDEDGFPCLVIDGSVPPDLGLAFVHDIHTISAVSRIYERITEVVDGHSVSRAYSGNSSTVSICPDRITIESDALEDDEPFEMSIDQYCVILDVWATYLNGSRR